MDNKTQNFKQALMAVHRDLLTQAELVKDTIDQLDKGEFQLIENDLCWLDYGDVVRSYNVLSRAYQVFEPPPELPTVTCYLCLDKVLEGDATELFKGQYVCDECLQSRPGFFSNKPI